MSGFIFFLAIGALSLPTLISFLLEGLGFSKTPAAGVWRGKVREGPYSVDVIVRRDERGIQLILPDRSVPKVVCEGVAKKLATELCALVCPLELPPEKVEIVNLGPVPTLCHYCLDRIEWLPFRCPRCGGLFCADHRLPENHDCPGGPSYATGEVVREAKGYHRERTRKKPLVLQEMPCG